MQVNTKVPINIMLFGPPGSGKGTFSQYLSKKHGYLHISPGNLLRQEVTKQTIFGKTIAPIMARGDYVPAKTVFTILAAKINKAI